AVGFQPATGAGEREAQGGAHGIYLRAAGGRRKGCRRHRLRRGHQRPHELGQSLSIERPVPEDVGQTAGCRRHRGHRRGWGRPAPAATPAPAPAAGTEFLAEAEKGKTYERPVAAGTLQEVRDADKFLYNEARAADGQWIHRNYLAK